MGTVAQFKQHDTGLPLIVIASYRASGRSDRLDLTDAVTVMTPVVFNMTPSDSSTPTIDRATAAVTAVDTAARTVTIQYDWASGDTATAGTYKGEFELGLTGGPATVPTGGYIAIEIVADLG